ncbi:MAG: hypothetical protein MJ106_05260, partial [Lentisphaeria bacterium]|nr:hypothetical protein [Lentisphaeria bacterium]
MSKLLNFLWLSVLLPMCLVAVEANVVDLAVKQRKPWNGKVDITFSLECEDENARIRVAFQAQDGDRDAAVVMTTLSGD